jgi:RNA polymerase sigma-70 factor (ECF subfamily)
MLLVGEGDTRAFEQIFDRHAQVAYSLACRICRQQPLAEDAVQEAFLSLWRNAERFDSARGGVRSWLLSVVHNRTIDALRRARVSDGRVVHDDELVERVPASELTYVEVLRRSEAAQVRTALDQLPSEQRRAIELSYYAGISHQQIAELLGLPTGTVKGRIRLGLHKLQTLLEDDLGAPVWNHDEHAAPRSLALRSGGAERHL